MYGLFSVGMVLLLGLLGGKVAHRFRVPRITGYMLTGLLMGPSVLKVISSDTLSEIHVLNEIALGLILFAIGGEFQLSRIRALGKRIIWIGMAESAGAFVLVFAADISHYRRPRPGYPAGRHEHGHGARRYTSGDPGV